MAALPRIAVILTGGTIDSVGNDRLDLAWYMEAGKRLKEGELSAGSGAEGHCAGARNPVPPPAESCPGRQGLARAPAHDPCAVRRGPGGRHRHHARHQYHRRDRLFPEPDLEDRQAGGGGRLHAAVVGDQRRRLSEHPERRQGRCRSGLARARLPARDERHDIQWAGRHQEFDLSGGSLPVARHGPAGICRRRRQGHLLSSADEATHG